MTVMLNHFVAAATNPMTVWFLALLAALALAAARRRTAARVTGVAASLLLWAFSCGWTGRLLMLRLERMYPPVTAEALPAADAIVLLGGGMGANPDTCPYPEMYAGADRVWHAARLWKAGKAPFVMASGTNEVLATRPLLLDLGVPESAIRIENASLNTEQNAKFVEALLADGRPAEAGSAKVLLVTSAWHMRRAKLMFERYAPTLEVVAAPCDHEATIHAGAALSPWDFFPNPGCLAGNCYALKEIIGYWGYKWLRR